MIAGFASLPPNMSAELEVLGLLPGQDFALCEAAGQPYVAIGAPEGREVADELVPAHR